MIEIRKLTLETVPRLWTVEDRRLDSEQVIVRSKPGGFDLDYKAMPGALWRVGNAEHGISEDLSAWIDDPFKEVYLSWLENALAGQILLQVEGNNLARIRDIRVAMSMRRRGVGEAMVALAEEWAKSKDQVGLLVETQDANAGACQFLTQCGFQLGGVDTLRYVARSSQTIKAAGLRESALFFYKFLR